MLSAVRAMAHRVAHDLAHMDMPRLGAEATPEQQDELIAEVMERALDAAKEAVDRGPEHLAVLKEAGVVDAGAYGLTVMMAGVVAALRGQEAPQLAHQPPPTHSLHRPSTSPRRFRFCTNFAVTGTGLEGPTFAAALERIGDSVLVVGDDRTIRVHVHTDEPEAALGDVRRRRRDLAARHGRHARADGRPHGAAGRAETSRPRPRSAPLWPWRTAPGSLGSSRSSARSWWTGTHDEPLDLRAARRHPLLQLRGGTRAAQQPERGHGRRTCR